MLRTSGDLQNTCHMCHRYSWEGHASNFIFFRVEFKFKLIFQSIIIDIVIVVVACWCGSCDCPRETVRLL